MLVHRLSVRAVLSRARLSARRQARRHREFVLSPGRILADGTRPLALSARHLARHLFVAGGSGQGKSKLIELLAVQLATQGCGFSLVDPHGDTARAVARRLAAAGVPPERVLYLRPGTDTCFSFDPAADAPVGGPPVEAERWREATVDRLIRTVLRGVALADQEVMNRLKRWLRNVFTACLVPTDAANAHVGLDRALTFCNPADPDFPALYGTVRDRLPADVRADFEKLIATPRPADQERWLESTINKLREVLSGPVRDVFGQRAPSLDLNAVLDRRMIVLLDLAESDHLSRAQGNTVGGLYLNFLIAAARRRGEGARTDHVLIVDEAENYVGEDLRMGFAELRKFRLTLALIFQDLTCLQRGELDLVSKVVSQCGLQLCFQQQNPDDVDFFARLFQYPFLDLTELFADCVLPDGYDWVDTVTTTRSTGRSVGRTTSHGTSVGEGRSEGVSRTRSESVSDGRSRSESTATGIQRQVSAALSAAVSEGESAGRSVGGGRTATAGTSATASVQSGVSLALGVTRTATAGTSATKSVTNTTSATNGTSRAVARGHTVSRTVGATDGESNGTSLAAGQSATERPRADGPPDTIRGETATRGATTTRTSSLSVSDGESDSVTRTTGATTTAGASTGTGSTAGTSASSADGVSATVGLTAGTGRSVGTSATVGESNSWAATVGRVRNRTEGVTRGHSVGVSLTRGVSVGTTCARTTGTAEGTTRGTSTTHGTTEGTAETTADTTGEAVTTGRSPLARHAIKSVPTGRLRVSVPDQLAKLTQALASLPERTLLVKCQGMDRLFRIRVHAVPPAPNLDLDAYLARVRAAHACYFDPRTVPAGRPRPLPSAPAPAPVPAPTTPEEDDDSPFA